MLHNRDQFGQAVTGGELDPGDAVHDGIPEHVAIIFVISTVCTAGEGDPRDV